MSAAEHLLVHALGSDIRIELIGVSAQEAAELRALWSQCLRDDAGEPIRLSVVIDRDPLVLVRHAEHDIVASSFPELAERLSGLITRTALRAQAGARVMLHAGGLADPESGRVAVLVAASGVGKTTATRALARHFEYVSDETIAIADDLSIAPYVKPLALKDGAEESLGWKTQAAPASLGLRLPSWASLRLGAIVFLERELERKDGPVPPELFRIPDSDALIRLVEQCSYLSALEAPLQQIQRVLDSVSGAYVLRYSEASTLVPIVEELFAGLRTVVPADDRWIRRADHTDAVFLNGRAHIQVDNTLVVLSEIATLLWSLSAQSLALRTASEAAQYAFGRAPDEETIASIVDELVDFGVLVAETCPPTATPPRGR